jgi:hypothetical protein
MPAFSSMTARAAGCGSSPWLATVAYSVPTARSRARRSRPTTAVARLGPLRLETRGALVPAPLGAAGESGICGLSGCRSIGASARLASGAWSLRHSVLSGHPRFETRTVFKIEQRLRTRCDRLQPNVADHHARRSPQMALQPSWGRSVWTFRPQSGRPARSEAVRIARDRKPRAYLG